MSHSTGSSSLRFFFKILIRDVKLHAIAIETLVETVSQCLVSVCVVLFCDQSSSSVGQSQS